MLYRVLKSIIHNTCRLGLVIVALRESERPKTAPKRSFAILSHSFSQTLLFPVVSPLSSSLLFDSSNTSDARRRKRPHCTRLA